VTRPLQAEWHRLAIAEANDGYETYEEAVDGDGERFRDRIREALAVICTQPEGYAAFEDVPEVRRVRLKPFSYYLVYRARGAALQVIAVAHTRRRPAYWSGRTG